MENTKKYLLAVFGDTGTSLYFRNGEFYRHNYEHHNRYSTKIEKVYVADALRFIEVALSGQSAGSTKKGLHSFAQDYGLTEAMSFLKNTEDLKITVDKGDGSWFSFPVVIWDFRNIVNSDTASVNLKKLAETNYENEMIKINKIKDTLALIPNMENNGETLQQRSEL